MSMLLNSQNLKYNMKGGLPIEPNYRVYDVIVSARTKPLAQQSLTSATLAKLPYVSKLKKKKMPLIICISINMMEIEPKGRICVHVF